MGPFSASILVWVHERVTEAIVRAAEDKSANPRVLEILTQVEEARVSVGLNPNVPREVLFKILESSKYLENQDSEMKIHVLGNQVVDEELLWSFARADSSERVRIY